MIQWVFFDVGNTLFSEDQAFSLVYKYLQKALREAGHEASFSELMTEREQFIKDDRLYAPFVAQATKVLGEEGFAAFAQEFRADLYQRWATINPPIPGMKDCVQEIAGWGVRVGIVANQPKECVDLLKAHDLWDIFGVHGISDVVNFKKPSKYFYTWALEESECPPEAALMVGDRVDNDVAPAKAVGMRTLWFPCAGEAKGAWPDMDEEDTLYHESVQRIAGSQIPPIANEQEPDYIAHTPEEMLATIQDILKS